MSHTLADRCRARIPAICARYGLPEPSSTTALTGGSANFNFVARFGAGDGHPPVKITFCLYKDLDGARRVADLLVALDDAPIGRLVGRPDDVALEAGRAVLVTRYTEGEPLDGIDRMGAFRVGELLASIHRAAPDAAPPHDMNRARLQRIAAGLEGPPDHDFRAFVADALRGDPGDGGLPAALIHGDLFLDNIIRRPDGALIAIDFEEACRAPRILDLAMTAVGFARWQAFEPGIITGLVAGYGTTTPLSPTERSALPAFVDRAAAAVAAWRRVATPDDMQAQGRDWRALVPVVATSRRWAQARIWRAITGV